MESQITISQEPKYTITWLISHILFVFGIAVILAIVVNCIDYFASQRVSNGMLQNVCYIPLSAALPYSFGVICLTCLSLMLIEIRFRKSVSMLQYGLTAMAVALFYLLLLAMTEKMPFFLAYTIVSAMTIALIGMFVKGLIDNKNAVRLIIVILLAEYIIMFILTQIGSMALLIGSLLLFSILAIIMYFTLKIKVDNNEIIMNK